MGADREDLREALKRVGAALKETGLPFALAGGYAAWARSAPEPDHDVDFLVDPDDAEKVACLLAEKGLQIVRPPEDWLFKVFTDDAMVDVIHRAGTSDDVRPALERASQVEVLSVWMPVLSATDVMLQKLSVLSEQYCDLGAVLPVARALREQVDWGVVCEGVAGNPYAEVTLDLLERLDVVSPEGGTPERRGPAAT